MPVNKLEEQYLPGKYVFTAMKKVADLEINYDKTRESMSEVSGILKRMDLYTGQLVPIFIYYYSITFEKKDVYDIKT